MSADPVDAGLWQRRPPTFVFIPDFLDFGRLLQNRKVMRAFYVRNLAGPIDACSVIRYDEHEWFRVVHVQSVNGYEQGCLRVTIEVDTSLLLPGRIHWGWLEVHLGAYQRRVQLAVEVTAAHMVLVERWRLFQTLVAPLLAALLISGLLSWIFSAETPFSTLLSFFAQH